MCNPIVELIRGTKACKKCYDLGRGYLLKQTGKTSNACARVASEYLVAAGEITKKFVSTRGLSDHLIDHYNYEVVLYVDELQPGDVIFTADMRGKRGWPDHVCICYSVTGKTVMVLDNYSPLPKVRNMQKGRRTAFGWALRKPE